MTEVTPPVRPLLRIERVHIEHLKAIRSLELPKNGLGWKDSIPDLVLVGGTNGTGKTTLLEVLFQSVDSLANPSSTDSPHGGSASISISLAWAELRQTLDSQNLSVFPSKTPVLHFVHTMKDRAIATQLSSNTDIIDGVSRSRDKMLKSLMAAASNAIKREPELLPHLLFLPSGRQLSTFETKSKTAGPLRSETAFSYRWSPPSKWQGSLESILYDARWMDLNAQAEGEPSPRFFEAFAEEFREFTGSKRLAWRKGELVVETADKQTHGLQELSSGEKQILLLLTDLNRLWTPGSLVMIDEPELHLHDQWQSHLFRRLKKLLEERGGQLWLATQSDTLFRMADPGSALILR